MSILSRAPLFATMNGKGRETTLGIARRRIGTLLGGGLALFAVVIISSSGAQAASGGNGLRVSPVRSDVTIQPGTSQTVNVTATNVTADTATLQTIVNDFTASSDESGNPAIILNPTQYASSHSLKRFVGPVSTFTLAPGQSKVVPIVITIPKNAAGGGYFGAVRFAPASTNYGSNQNLSLAGSVGSLILAKVPGNITEKLTIASFDTRTDDHVHTVFTTNKKITATARFQNQGNVQEAPFGKILLRDRSNKVLATYEVNNTTPAANVLPDSIRKFTVPLDKVGSFGKFKLQGNFGYGANGQLLTASTTFYVVPLPLVIAVVVLIALILFAIFVLPKMVRGYNRRIVRAASKRR